MKGVSKFAIVFLILLVSNIARGQGTMARLHYEKAEEQFAGEDYEASIKSLDEAEKLLGQSNSKVLYLRVLAQAKLIEKKKASGLVPSDLDIISSAQANAKLFLEKYSEQEGTYEKIKEIFKVHEQLETYPKDINEMLVLIDRPLKVLDSIYAALSFKPSLEGFYAENPQYRGKAYKLEHEDGLVSYGFNSNSYGEDLPGPNTYYLKDNKVQMFVYTVMAGQSPEKLKATYFALKTQLIKKLPGAKVQDFDSLMADSNMHIVNFDVPKADYILSLSVSWDIVKSVTFQLSSRESIEAMKAK